MGTDIEVRHIRYPWVDYCEYIGPEGYLWSSGNRLYSSETVDGELTLVAEIPVDAKLKPFLRTRLTRRLARQSFTEAIPVDGFDRIFFAYDRSVGIISNGEVSILGGRAVESRLLRNGAACLPNGDIVFGDYWSNADRSPVHLYRLKSGADEVYIDHVFPAGYVRHVHSVRWDVAAERVVVATGDVGAESRIVTFDAEVENARTIAEDGESARAISVLFNDRSIYYGTDAEFRANTIRKMDRNSGVVSDIAQVNGPVFYSAPFRDGWLFGSTAEMCPSQMSPEAILYYLDPSSDTVQEVARFRKDALPLKLFQLGTIAFPRVKDAGRPLVLSGTALRGLDGSLVAVY